MTKLRILLLGLLALALTLPAAGIAGPLAAHAPAKKHPAKKHAAKKKPHAKKAAASAAALRFSGTTSQGKTISFTLAAGHKQLTALKLGFTLDCPNGMQPISADDQPFGKTGTAAVAANGTFKATDTQSSVSGSISGTSAHGTIDLQAALTDQSGASIGTCSSGAVTWTATGK